MIMSAIYKIIRGFFGKTDDVSWLSREEEDNILKSICLLKVRKAFRVGRPVYSYIMGGAEGSRLNPGDTVHHQGTYFIVKEVYAKHWVKVDG